MTTRKHFKSVAEAIDAERPIREGGPTDEAIHEALDAVTRRIGDIFYADNPRFDRARFYRAAGIREYQ